MVIIDAAFTMLGIVLVPLVAVDGGLIIKVVMHLLVIVVHAFLWSSPSVVEPLVIVSTIPLFRTFVVSLLPLPLVVVRLILASRGETVIAFMAILRLAGASTRLLCAYITIFLHHLVILVVLPLLILVRLRDIITPLLDDLAVPIFWVLIVVLVLAEVVIVIPTMVVRVLIPTTAAMIVALVLTVSVISIPSIILVII